MESTPVRIPSTDPVINENENIANDVPTNENPESSPTYINPTPSSHPPETAYMHADLPPLSPEITDVVNPLFNLSSLSDAHAGSDRDNEFQCKIPSPGPKCSSSRLQQDKIAMSPANPSRSDTSDTSSSEDLQMDPIPATSSWTCSTSTTCEDRSSIDLSFAATGLTHTALPASLKIVDPVLGHSSNAGNRLVASSTETLTNQRELNIIVNSHFPLSPPAVAVGSSTCCVSAGLDQSTSSPCSPLPRPSPPQTFSSPPSSIARYSDDIFSDNISDCVTDENLEDTNASSSPPTSPLRGCAIPSAGLECDSQNVIIPVIDPTNNPSKLGKADTEMKSESSSIDTSHPVIVSNKRKRSLENMDPSTSQQQTCSLVPVNKRPTLVCQKISFRKLAMPFKSPVMKEPIATQNRKESKPSSKADDSHVASDLNTTIPGINAIYPASLPSFALRAGTKRATTQFKSPLTTRTNGSTSLFPVRLTPTVQALQRDVQVLKRAVKVKQNGEEKELERLVKKWTEAGREVAYELWALVKDNDKGAELHGNATNAKGWIEGNWGWEAKKVEQEGKGTVDGMTDTKADDQVGQAEADEDDGKADTLGTMLRQLGIAPETLGWDEEEETFTDE